MNLDFKINTGFYSKDSLSYWKYLTIESDLFNEYLW